VQLKPLIVLLAAGAVVAAGCSSSAAKSSSPHPSPRVTTTTRAPGGPYTRPACNRDKPAPVVATRVTGSNSDVDIRSFDGTSIRVHWFPRSPAGGSAAPTVLKGPGWGQPGDVNVAGSGYGLFGDLGIGALNAAGYNVLTWDPRGFGRSTGTVESDSPAFEGRDVQRLIDWVSEQPGVQLDKAGDPRMGMVGASYGGGIQLVTAAIDCRIDAIVPQIAWHSLGTSLYKSHITKRGWGDLLYAAASSRSLDPHITSAHAASDTTGVTSAADSQWFLDRGPGDLVSKITAPTLIEQGTIDTLFTLDEAATNYAILHAHGVPTGLIWMCSGHGVCLTNPGNQSLPGTAAIAWLNRYVKGDTSASVGAPFEYVDQNGAEYTADEYPPRASSAITASGNGHLTLIADGGSGPAKATGPLGALGGFALPITPAKASHAVNLPITVASAAKVAGAPKLTIRYSGSTPAGAAPTRVFAQLVDDSTGLVLGNQITPIAVVLDGNAHTETVPLEMVAFTAKPGSRLTLQIVATTIAYTQPRLGGAISFDSVQIELPTVTGVTPVAVAR
jgi:ABC-2 type transport system ATP-binding protein